MERGSEVGKLGSQKNVVQDWKEKKNNCFFSILRNERKKKDKLTSLSFLCPTSYAWPKNLHPYRRNQKKKQKKQKIIPYSTAGSILQIVNNNFLFFHRLYSFVCSVFFLNGSIDINFNEYCLSVIKCNCFASFECR